MMPQKLHWPSDIVQAAPCAIGTLVAEPVIDRCDGDTGFGQLDQRAGVVEQRFVAAAKSAAVDEDHQRGRVSGPDRPQIKHVASMRAVSFVPECRRRSVARDRRPLH